jgi:hypothetical protein
MRKDIDAKQTVPSLARRHFFHLMSSAAGALALPALSRPAKASLPFHHGGFGCFLRGTRILTPQGAERVENLSIGGSVITARGEAKPIKWIGCRRFSQGSSARWPDDIHPIRVAQSALADNVPHADLYLSPLHALFIDGVLIPVKDLLNGASITRALPEDRQDIEYFHIELAIHEVIFAEGAPVETLLVTDGRERFTNFVEYERLYGGETGPAMVPYAPVVGYLRGRDHLKALLRLGVSHVIDVRDPTQVAYDRILARANASLPVA